MGNSVYGKGFHEGFKQGQQVGGSGFWEIVVGAIGGAVLTAAAAAFVHDVTKKPERKPND